MGFSDALNRQTHPVVSPFKTCPWFHFAARIKSKLLHRPSGFLLRSQLVSSCPSTAHHTCRTPAPAWWSFSPDHTCLWLSSALRRNLSSLPWPPRPRHPLQPHFPRLSPHAAWSPHSPTPALPSIAWFHAAQDQLSRKMSRHPYA